MGTSFKEIYCLANTIKSNDRINALVDYDYYYVMNSFLKNSISEFYFDCVKNLDDRVDFSKTEYRYENDGSNQYLLTIPPPKDFELFVGYRYDTNNQFIETKNYEYDEVSNSIIIHDSDVKKGYEVLIVVYVVGSFAEELNIAEKIILAEGMMIPYIEEYVNDSSSLEFTPYIGSKMHSQAEHIAQTNKRVQDQIARVHKLISRYSYNSQPTQLFKLGSAYYE